MGKLIDVVEYLLRYASETLSAKVWATTSLLTYLFDYTIGEKKQQTFITQQNITQQEVQTVDFLNIHRN
jgi:hypothetical protein